MKISESIAREYCANHDEIGRLVREEISLGEMTERNSMAIPAKWRLELRQKKILREYGVDPNDCKDYGRLKEFGRKCREMVERQVS